MGTLAMACLLWVAGAAPVDVYPINQRSFQIPIHIDPARRADFKELELYSSIDQGRSWQKEGVATPDKEAFTFYAPADGLYWFTVVAIDQRGNREPPDINKAPPSQKILIDTVKPILQIVTAERQGDDLLVRWNIQEDNPDLATLKLEYRTPEMPAFQWSPVTVNQATSDQTRFHVTGPGPVSLRMQVQDQAGNVASAQTEVAAAAAAPSAPVAPASPLTTQASFTAPAPAVPPLPQTAGSGMAGSQWEHVQPQPPPARVEQRPTNGYGQPSWGGTAEGGTRTVATTDPVPSPGMAVTPAAGSNVSRGTLPPLQVVNTPQVTLEYEVERFGPSGVGSVELYLTRDDGVTWQRFATDQDLKPPSSADLAGPSPTLRRPLTVELPGEGIYGLYLVVRSGAGLGKPPPQGGDAPQMRVEVDTTRPEARLYAPEPVPGLRNTLVLSWTATDRNLTPNPITLQWAERQGGPWVDIVADLPNLGRFNWKLPPSMPDRVYLRLTVRDTAGNVAVAETREPVLVDLSEPEGHIMRIAGAGRRP